ncbi:SNARE complex subunit Tlg2 [Sodiomyces alkalinus F11]|uniref:SNARE complex subunit Tlg2 n=1 Tax=Sodiomyces alkalinus (strain CBS 110278 / VKM F-3762 / F11) TaxID=1314773 RepID=A0A3N2PKE3_SODAK|nr:SNARE complex subunit Tlg2 [Sodiomyces alkalinus F11]ROT34786.1 SNARE complex subunit Tlg2 [Sodiomyces alkalinus F11]
MWRDRTNLYLSYRQSYADHPVKRAKYTDSQARGASSADSYGLASSDTPEDTRALLSAGAFDREGDAVIEMDVIPPRWADVSDEITELLADIARRSQVLERLHQTHVLPGFNDDATKKNEEREIEGLTHQITKGFHDCNRCIQRLERMIQEMKEAGSLSRADATMAKNMQISLASRVQDASASFRRKQSTYLKKLRDMGGFTSISSPGDRMSALHLSSGAYSDPNMLESDEDRSLSQSTLQSTRKYQHHSNDTIITQREREIEEIARGIIELADIFRDLQSMVIDQGTMLDRIDYNVENMANDVKAADKEFVIAAGYQKRTTKRKIILLLLILIVGLFILLMIKPKENRGAPANGNNNGKEQA